MQSRSGPHRILISQAEILDLASGGSCLLDLRICGSQIQEMGSLRPKAGETLVPADGRLLLPGLSDHHLHFRSLAAAENSVNCGPPAVSSAEELARQLSSCQPETWLRGTGYHESVAGDLTRSWLDTHGPEGPVRIQHRGGRLWILNSPALSMLQSRVDEPLPEDGRLFDRDELLHQLTGDELPVQQLSRRLAAYGITAFNDMTPGNHTEAGRWFHKCQQKGRLLQKVRLSGRPELRLPPEAESARLSLGETKFHLHEDRLPGFERFCSAIKRSHAEARPVAIHAVTETVLVYAVAGLREAGVLQGDRVEHASLAPPAMTEALAELGLTVVTQPNFVAERGDSYLRDLPLREQSFLYPAASLERAGVRLAFGSDAPFGSPDPWFAMQSAVRRRTASGLLLGEAERLTPEAALRGFLGSPAAPGEVLPIQEGDAADLLLLDAPWAEVRQDFAAGRVLLTLIDGKPVYQRD